MITPAVILGALEIAFIAFFKTCFIALVIFSLLLIFG